MEDGIESTNMPIYKNVTSTRQSLNGKVVEPNQEIYSLVYYNENDIQLLKVKDEPFYNSILLSEKYKENVDVQVPEYDNLHRWVTKYSIHFYVESGEVLINYNSLRNGPSLKLYTGCKWNERVFERNIDKIFVRCIQGTNSFVLWIIIERLP